MLHYLRKIIKKNKALRRVIGYYVASSGLVDSYFRCYKVSPDWQLRIENSLSSTDNAFIPRVRHAGSIKNGTQIMHNGLRIRLGSYYGPEYSQMLIKNKGVHEPQEERVFQEVLKTLPSEAVMIEMGAFWSFYSMWFNKSISHARNFMIEPDDFNLGQGKRNFRLNGLQGEFIQAFVGNTTSAINGVPAIRIDDFIKSKSLEFIHVLHSDIQGYEFEMLLGASKSIDENKIGYVFISTHSNDVHYKCLNFLLEKCFKIVASADLNETYSEDGLIVGCSPNFNSIQSISISSKNSGTNTA